MEEKISESKEAKIKIFPNIFSYTIYITHFNNNIPNTLFAFISPFFKFKNNLKRYNIYSYVYGQFINIQ